MKRYMAALAIAVTAGWGVGAAAQSGTAQSGTSSKTGSGNTVTVTGCLENGSAMSGAAGSGSSSASASSSASGSVHPRQRDDGIGRDLIAHGFNRLRLDRRHGGHVGFGQRRFNRFRHRGVVGLGFDGFGRGHVHARRRFCRPEEARRPSRRDHRHQLGQHERFGRIGERRHHRHDRQREHWRIGDRERQRRHVGQHERTQWRDGPPARQLGQDDFGRLQRLGQVARRDRLGAHRAEIAGAPISSNPYLRFSQGTRSHDLSQHVRIAMRTLGPRALAVAAPRGAAAGASSADMRVNSSVDSSTARIAFHNAQPVFLRAARRADPPGSTIRW